MKIAWLFLALLFPACVRVGVPASPDLSVLNIFPTAITEPAGTKLTVYVENNGVATPALDFVVAAEQPTLFIQTDLPNQKMQVAISTSSGGVKSLPLNDAVGSGSGKRRFQAYGRERLGNKVIIGKMDGPARQLIYVAPTPQKQGG